MTPKEYKALIGGNGTARKRKAPKPILPAPAQEWKEAADKAAREAKAAKAKEIHDAFMERCIVEGLPTPQTEFVFHDVRQWRFDYLFRVGERMVAVEVEGGLDMPISGHKSADGIRRDMEKYNEAQRLGIRVARCEPKTLNDDYVFQLIKDLLSL